MRWLKNSSAARAIGVGLLAALTLGASACTLGGAAAGGYVGNKATNGSAVGTVGGAVAGGVIGHELSK
ncbi:MULTISPECIES: glycine zipper 2TM domain-containing protein [unclassified Paraburkholderia]|uniref:glycine zipper 2TM domain-containing protein n=1 Tax=unclassified Paraburkholderia TaxID=2615204 RepID=UPI001981ADC9|nr:MULTISPECIES: glycine zipper 2TM domain-containing protein [unclassified Paraburkholderia]MBN3855691.1 glycine zipper 2TM domain-containing protein [Paraburkholderia sp. Ac-20340]